MSPNKIIGAFKSELIQLIEKKYLFANNIKTNRDALAIEATGLFHTYIDLLDVPNSIKYIDFVDNTSTTDADKGHMILMVKAGDTILSVTEFFEKLETYLNKK